MLLNKENVDINCYCVREQCSSILNLPHIVPVCMLPLVKSHHCTKVTWGQDSQCDMARTPHHPCMAFIPCITKNTLKHVPYLPIDGELFRVHDHKLLLFIMPTQEPMNSAAPWRSTYTVPVIPKRQVYGNSFFFFF